MRQETLVWFLGWEDPLEKGWYIYLCMCAYVCTHVYIRVTGMYHHILSSFAKYIKIMNICWLFSCVCMLVSQLCLTLCNFMDCTLPGSSVHEISQARILEWVAISFSRGSSWPRYQTWVFFITGRLYNLCPPPIMKIIHTWKIQNALRKKCPWEKTSPQSSHCQDLEICFNLLFFNLSKACT